MAKKQMLVQFGMGTSLRRESYTDAAVRAVKDALWHNSISLAELFETEKSAMILDVEIGAQEPAEIDLAAVAGVFPYGSAKITTRRGGLDIPKPDGAGKTVVANAAIRVSFEIEDTK